MEDAIDPQVQEWDASGKPIAAAPSPASSQATEWDASGKPIPAATASPKEPGMLEPHHDWTDPIRGAAAGIKQLVTHPLDSLVGMPNMGGMPGVAYGQAGQQAQQAQIQATQQNAQNVHQFVSDTAQAAQDHPAFVAGQVAGPALLMHGIAKTLPVAGRIPAALEGAKQAFTQTAYPENISIPPQAVATQNLVRAMIPDAAAIPNIKSAAPELSDVLASVQKKGAAINGKLDAAQAIRDRANEIQAHYDDNVLKPNGTEINTVPGNYNGDTSGGANRATLNQINDRVDDINAEMKSNFRKKVASQTTEANASDADLLSEKQGLTKILHGRLADLTGLQPEDIASLRQRAGKLRSLAQEVEISADRDSVAAGRTDTNGGAILLKNPLGSAAEKVGGGQEIIGNRIFKNALTGFVPAENPLPQPSAPAAGVATTPEMAQQEFLRQQQLEQAAQDAGAQRAAVAEQARTANAAQSIAKQMQDIQDRQALGNKLRQEAFERFRNQNQ